MKCQSVNYACLVALPTRQDKSGRLRIYRTNVASMLQSGVNCATLSMACANYLTLGAAAGC
jgi:hypothetical protein